MALRITPSLKNASATSNTGIYSAGAPSAPGIHDTLRTKLSLADTSASSFEDSPHQSSDLLQSTHPLEARLRNWQSNEHELKLNLLRRQFGIGEPLRRGMELKVCREAEWRPLCLGGSTRIGEDILTGRDTQITWEDIYDGQDRGKEGEVQAQIEAKVGI